MKQKEITKGYIVTSMGEIISVKRKSAKFLKQPIGSNGYPMVAIGRPMVCVHRLVAETFIPNPDRKPCINHKDGNKLNNRVENLEWCTYSENMKHAVKEGIAGGQFKKGSNRKLTDEQIERIRKDMRSSRKIALDYGISHSTVLHYKNNM